MPPDTPGTVGVYPVKSNFRGHIPTAGLGKPGLMDLPGFENQVIGYPPILPHSLATIRRASSLQSPKGDVSAHWALRNTGKNYPGPSPAPATHSGRPIRAGALQVSRECRHSPLWVRPQRCLQIKFPGGICGRWALGSPRYVLGGERARGWHEGSKRCTQGVTPLFSPLRHAPYNGWATCEPPWNAPVEHSKRSVFFLPREGPFVHHELWTNVIQYPRAHIHAVVDDIVATNADSVIQMVQKYVKDWPITVGK